MDFLTIATKCPKKGELEIYPKLIIKNPSSDLMIRGGDFYAVWLEEKGMWSTVEQDATDLIDAELDRYYKENADKFDGHVKIMHMWDAETGQIDKWHKYVQKQMRDSFHMLDEKIIFSNNKPNKKDYASKRLNYPLEAGSTEAYDRIMSTLYSEEERHKLEWAIGSIVSGDSTKIQKFLVLYGAAGTGKSTVLNIIQQLFDGYFCTFDAKALGSANAQFALEPFKDNPLVAIQHDGDLSKIEDNTRLNSLVSHELMTVNEKFKGQYAARFKCFLFMGTNKPVKITDAKSGLIRRLIDVSPSGNKLSASEYRKCTNQIKYELGAIAHHCLNVYLEDPGYYDDYIPVSMLGASNDFYNFVEDSYPIFKKEDGTTLKAAWEMYKQYCDYAKVQYPYSQRVFKEELKNYFNTWQDRYCLDDGTRVRNWYGGFKVDKFEKEKPKEKSKKSKTWLDLTDSVVSNGGHSMLDILLADCLAQYATSKETPSKKWENVTTLLRDIQTSRLHYVKVPINHIVIDFDIPDENGEKSLEKNLEAANKWPKTYAEVSKSGKGLHLHYIYTGDPTELSSIIEEHIELKVYSGNSSLRRKLTLCNDIPIATISSGLPLKEAKKTTDKEIIKSEKGLRTLIKRNLRKEIHPGTKPSIDFIFKILEDAYNSGMIYDVSNMRSEILAFAANSSHQAEYCVKLVSKMHFKSETPGEAVSINDRPIIFYDVEVFPNLFIVNWKIRGKDKPVVRMINPKPAEIEELLNYRLIGFNCRRYDNHILYARLMGYPNAELFKLSSKIVAGNSNCFFGEAYNLSYTDVYDFASAGNKKSLKKLEIEMGIHHQELGLPWDQPVPEELWDKVAAYCDNDVIATEAAFDYLEADWTARQILADLAEMTVNDTTNSLTQKIIFGNNRKPQSEFCYRNLAEPVKELDEEVERFLKEACPKMMEKPFGKAKSKLPYFEGYIYDHGKSTYRGEEVGEGGYVYAEPGMYGNVALLDIASMHPHSAIAECLFGPEFTRAFREIVEGRVDIKHEAWDIVDNILGGKLRPYIQKVKDGLMSAKSLANALKTAINSVYGLTSASFDNPFRDPRNIDNIVAKRGALFMIDLKHAVQEQGFTVVHIKTDSIKIADATPDIIQFVKDYGERYGYTFEHEATYDRICLVNDAVYIAKDASDGHWTATGTQFQVPYVFKNLFSHEPLEFNDFCETKSVTSSLYLDMNENLPQLTAAEEKELSILDKAWHADTEEAIGELIEKKRSNYEELSARYSELCKKAEAAHNYIFIGRVGQFCPIKDGCGGGILLREKDGKYYAATGSKGYRWLESEMVKTLNKEDDIDESYYKRLADEAVDTINEYGDYNWFVSDEPYVGPKEMPFVQDYISYELKH